MLSYTVANVRDYVMYYNFVCYIITIKGYH